MSKNWFLLPVVVATNLFARQRLPARGAADHTSLLHFSKPFLPNEQFFKQRRLQRNKNVKHRTLGQCSGSVTFLGRIRIQTQPLLCIRTLNYGSESCSFLQWLSRCQEKKYFFQVFFLISFCRYRYIYTSLQR
jgi:hypothetical protein